MALEFSQPLKEMSTWSVRENKGKADSLIAICEPIV
jgi:hypothetical protein